MFTTLVVVVALGGCHKDPPHRAKRMRAHAAPSATSSANDDDSPPPPPSPPGAATSPPVPTPAPVAPVVAAPPAAPPALSHGRHQLTVDCSAPSRPPRPAVSPAAPATGEPAPDDKPSGKAVTEKRAPASSVSPCQGGTFKGERLSVQGVAADDVLNVREAPDKASAVLGALPPDATGVQGTANRRRVGASTWREVECGTLRGWVNERFLARETGN